MQTDVRTQGGGRGREKTFPRTNKGGYAMFAHPPKGSLFFFHGKFWGVLRGLLRKVPYAEREAEPRDLKAS